MNRCDNRLKCKLFILMIACTLLVGCQQETGELPEIEDQAAGTDNTIAMESEEDEAIQSVNEAKVDTTTISILGKTDLEIESDRIHDERYGLNQLNNLFTLDEINMILNTIKGTWVVDEYIGFVSYDVYGLGYLMEEAEAWDKYNKAKELASTNIPDLTISIKEYDTVTKGIADIENNYIYVRASSGVRYDSPMSIVLSMSLSEDAYPVFANRTMVGVATESSYPVIYIEFFSVSDSETEGKVIYEPATLVLASDGQFLLLKEGGFYTLKKDIASEIMSGNFENVNDEKKRRMENYYNQMQENDNYIWKQIDLNGDGMEELVLQEAYYVGKHSPNDGIDARRIVGIFADQGEYISCVMWDDQDKMEFSFCGSTGELMYYHRNVETGISEEIFEHFAYDSEWNRVTDYTIVIDYVDSLESIPEHWFEVHPDIPREEGIYHRKYEGIYTVESEPGEVLTDDKFQEIFRTEMGYEYFSLL